MTREAPNASETHRSPPSSGPPSRGLRAASFSEHSSATDPDFRPNSGRDCPRRDITANLPLSPRRSSRRAPPASHPTLRRPRPCGDDAVVPLPMVADCVWRRASRAGCEVLRRRLLSTALLRFDGIEGRRPPRSPRQILCKLPLVVLRTEGSRCPDAPDRALRHRRHVASADAPRRHDGERVAGGSGRCRS